MRVPMAWAELRDWYESFTSMLENFEREGPRDNSRFTASDRIDLLMTSPPPLPEGREAAQLFYGLAPYFDAGLCAQDEIGDGRAWTVEGCFVFGDAFAKRTGNGPRVTLNLPELHGGQVLRTQARAVLSACRFENVGALGDHAVFAFLATPGSIYLLFCNRPPLWQGPHIETSLEVIRALLAAAILRSNHSETNRGSLEAE